MRGGAGGFLPLRGGDDAKVALFPVLVGTQRRGGLMLHSSSLLDRGMPSPALAAVAISGCMGGAGESPSDTQGTGGRGGINMTGTAGVPVIPLPPSDLPPESACSGSAPGTRQLRR